MTEDNIQLKFYETNWFMWLCLLFLPPVGIFLMWKNEKFKPPVRVILSVLGAIWFFLGVIFYSTILNSNKVELDKLRTTNSLNETQISNQSSELELLKTEIKELKERVSNLEAENTTLTTDNTTLTTDNSNLNSDISGLESDNALLHSENEELKKPPSESSTPSSTVTPSTPATPSSSSKPAPVSQAPAQAPAKESSKEPVKESQPESSKEDQRIVYWVANGKSYHYTRDCATLKRSTNIYEGTQSQSGKYDPCNVCAGG